jgi:hypothetical protein
MMRRPYERLTSRYPSLAVVVPVVLLAVIAISAFLAWRVFGFDWARSDGDPWNYLAAGERLNAGHPLYALSPGDRPVVIVPPYWTVPLLAPPPIAVFWRPLALLGESSMLLWGLAGLIGVLGSAIFLARRSALLVVAILATDLALTVLSGNASALILPMLIGAWVYRDRPWIAGALVAVAGAVKLLPLVLVLWLVVTGRWKALAAALAVGVAILLVSLLGAGPEAFVAWFESARTAAPSPRSLAVLTGLPSWLVVVALAVPIVLLGRWDRLSFGAAILATAFATPAYYFSAWALLAALPVWRDRRPQADGSSPRQANAGAVAASQGKALPR